MKKSMQNKVGIVTGAGNGIGRASAIAFSEAGAKVIVSDISEDAGYETVKIIQEQGGEAHFVKCNVAKEEEVKNLINETLETFGKLDWAHNNAGIGAPTGSVTEIDTERWQRVIDVTLTGTFLCLKHEIPAMLESGGGAIVNTASTGGLVGTPGLTPYISAKHGVNGLTKSAALEFGKQNIRINSICPGMTRTASVESWSQESAEQAKAFESGIPLGRMGVPSEQANAAVWLCSDQSSFITGINLPVDGGETAE
ncbi:MULTISPECIES: glucose 1-dehydrogenase [Staphylococcus]|uniref:glucose 1-dehydrogenase n=1 Tax=Staphylococcus TaxID=1279 RepID=UPI003CF154A0